MFVARKATTRKNIQRALTAVKNKKHWLLTRRGLVARTRIPNPRKDIPMMIWNHCIMLMVAGSVLE
jgi:hypothetical protein